MEALLQVEAVSNSRNSLKVKEETCGNLLCPILVNKIPADLQLTVSKKVPEAEWKLTTLLATIEEEIVARERPGWSKAPRRGEDKSPSTATTYPCDEGHTFCCPNLLLL